MKRSKTSISRARTYADTGAYWDEHDLSDFWTKTRKVKFEVVLEPEATYYPVKTSLAEKIQSVARQQGVRSDTLVNRWLGQKLEETRKRSGRLKARSA